uniref:Uncharacterized protein n=1 Tax=viral metagenome TaxID=1070528 RepID=A0A6C0ANW3_9ZZZZ
MCEKGHTEKQAWPAGPDPLYKAQPCTTYGVQQAWPAGPDWCSVIRTPTPSPWPTQSVIRQIEIKQEQERNVRIKRILQENKPALK